MPPATATVNPPAFVAPGAVDVEAGGSPLASRKRERFAQLVAQGFKAADAYRQAFDADGSTAATVRVEAARLVTDPSVAPRVDFLRANIAAHDAAAFAITRARVLAEVARMALYDVRGSIGEDGRPLPLHELPDDLAAAVEQVDVLTGPDGKPTAWRYKFARKSAATDQLARMLGMYEQDNRQKAGSLADALAALADRTGAAPSLAARLAAPAQAPADAQPAGQIDAQRAAGPSDGPAPV